MDDGLKQPGGGRTVLVLTYRWPPQGGGGVQRTLKLVKYLTELGWKPVVHTVANPYSRLWDPSLSSEVPEAARVYRTPTLEYEAIRNSLSKSGAALLRTLRRGGGGSVGDEEKAASASQPSAAGSPAEDTLGTRAHRRGRGRVSRAEDWIWSRVLIPDPQIVWAALSYLPALMIARREKPDVLYSSSPPNSLNILALRLARSLGLPWVADFRDPWTDGLRRQQWYPDHPARQRREEAWERSVFEEANQVLVTTNPARDTFVEKYPWCPPERVGVLTNGFDPADFAHATGSERLLEPGFLHLSLSGNVETMFDLGPFLRAVRSVVENDSSAREILRVNFLGTKRQPIYDQALEDYGIGDVVRYHAYMPHERVVRMVEESDALMLCQIPAMESGGVKLPGKMFEYLYTRKAILALTIPGETTSILERTGVGRVVDPEDEAAIRVELERMVAEFRRGGVEVTPQEEAIAAFDRQAQARDVSEILDRAIAEGRRRAG